MSSFTAAEFNVRARRMGRPGLYRGGVVTAHGMKTTGGWQKRFTTVCFDRGIYCSTADFGFILLGVISNTVHHQMGDVILEHHREVQDATGLLPNIVAHSLGTLAFGKMLLARSAVRFRHAVLNGCILPESFPWAEILRRGQIEMVLNECGGSDFWPWAAPAFIPGAGRAGRKGFKTSDGRIINARNPWADHGSAHHMDNYERVWLPFLMHGRIPQ